MSHYGDMYHAQAEESLIRQWCPAWAETESHRVKLALSQGRKDGQALSQAQDAFASLNRALKQTGL